MTGGLGHSGSRLEQEEGMRHGCWSYKGRGLHGGPAQEY